MASSSLSLADHTRKSRKVAVEYSTDETDEDKIPDMEKGMAFPRKMKTVKLTLPATPSQVHLARSFVEWFAYHGMRPGIRAALVSRKWTDGMIDEFIDNFRHKHGFNRQTAMLPYDDEGDSDNEPIELEGRWKMVILTGTVTSPDCCYRLNQASLTIHAGGRAGEFPVGKTNRSQTATDVVMVIK